MNFPVGSRHFLVEGVVRNDAEAIAASVEQPDEFVVIFDRHFQAVYGFLARRFGADAAPDLAAETFARALEARARYRPETPTALPWLLGIATRVGANERRREESRLRAYASAAGRADVVVDTTGDGLLESQVAAALARLKRGDRDAVLLLAWADLTYDEIAAALAIPVGTVRSRINRARRQLRDALAETPRGSGEPLPERECDRA